MHAAMAQQVEHVLGKDEVTGSNPVSSSIGRGASLKSDAPFFIGTKRRRGRTAAPLCAPGAMLRGAGPS